MPEKILLAAEEALYSYGLSREDAVSLLKIEAPEKIHLLLVRANQVRARTRGDEIEFCAIINARSGRCSEDCAFCAQSVHHQSKVETYPLLSVKKILEAAAAARDQGACRFSIVTSGKAAHKDRELEQIAEAVQGIAELGLSPCASLGLLTEEAALVLKQAGLKTYHHNLEAAPDYYPEICSTHGLEERLDTARLAKKVGLRLCCGGILGLGESIENRVDLALAIRELEADSIPLNFLNPIPGTRLENTPPLKPLEILKAVAVFRLIAPNSDIRTCGGREQNLRGLQPLMFLAGANATMIGNYLTTAGRSPADDARDVLDLGLSIRKTAP